MNKYVDITSTDPLTTKWAIFLNKICGQQEGLSISMTTDGSGLVCGIQNPDDPTQGLKIIVPLSNIVCIYAKNSVIHLATDLPTNGRH